MDPDVDEFLLNAPGEQPLDPVDVFVDRDAAKAAGDHLLANHLQRAWAKGRRRRAAK